MARKTIPGFIRDQRKPIPPVVKADLTDKTVIVVGANTGLGFEATKHFATMDPGRLILACRNREKGDAAIAKLEEETGYMKSELWIIDLSDFSSVKRFADRYETEGGRLDILVENAGIIATEYQPTPDGWESTLQVNCLALSLLALLLLPRMIQTAQIHSTAPRLVVVSSDLHYMTSIPKTVTDTPNILQTLSSKEYCTPKVMRDRYFVSKLLNVFFVRALNSYLPPPSPSTPPITITAVNPGYCYSDLRRSLPCAQAAFFSLMEKALALSTEQGSRQLVYAAVGGEEDRMQGGYVSFSEVVEVSDYVLGEEGGRVQERIWDEMVDVLAAVDPRVRQTVDDYLTAHAA